MARRIFITATNTDIGKTYTTLKLLHYYAGIGYRVGAFKPFETGVVQTPPDGTLLLETVRKLNPEFNRIGIDAIVPLQFELPAAPFVAGNGARIDFDKIDTALAAIEPLCDVLIIEGAGGLLVPLDEDHMIIDLIRYFKASTLLVSHCRLGCINDTLLNLNLLDNEALPYRWILNCRDTDTSFKSVSAPYFLHRFGTIRTIEHDLPQIAESLLT